jgi:hypothetical protein
MLKNKLLLVGLFVLISVLALTSCAPKVTGFNPKSGRVETEVTIDGENFKSQAGENTVKFDGVIATDVRKASKNQIIVSVPNGAKTGKISVTTNRGTGNSDEDFAVIREGYALAIGLNRLDPAHYGGWDGSLTGCEPDARDMKDIAVRQGLNAEILLTAQATREAVIGKLNDLAEKMQADDLLVVSYSGHGGQVLDQNGDEADGLDETWCLYNGQLIDDELNAAWAKFKKGIRILVFSDSCHSGTVLKMMKSDFENPAQSRVRELNNRWREMREIPDQEKTKIRSFLKMEPTPKGAVKVAPGPELISRLASAEVLRSVYQRNREFYTRIGREAPREDTTPVQAFVILISGCEDNQTSADLGDNGLFTFMLKKVWNNGEFSGSHLNFHQAIKTKVVEANSGQSPKYYTVGIEDNVFVMQRPYTVK